MPRRWRNQDIMFAESMAAAQVTQRLVQKPTDGIKQRRLGLQGLLRHETSALQARLALLDHRRKISTAGVKWRTAIDNEYAHWQSLLEERKTRLEELSWSNRTLPGPRDIEKSNMCIDKQIAADSVPRFYDRPYVKTAIGIAAVGGGLGAIGGGTGALLSGTAAWHTIKHPQQSQNGAAQSKSTAA